MSATAIILAGSRPGPDPFAAAHDVPQKSLIPVSGKAMLARVVQSLSAHTDISNIEIVSQDITALAADGDVAEAVLKSKAHLIPGASSIAASLQPYLADAETPYPLLITTADNVLLSQNMVDEFIMGAKDADIAIAVVERQTLEASYPHSRRTWLKFRGGQYSGANLFLFGSAKAMHLLSLWAEVEQDRKKGWKMLSVFGPWTVFLALMRLSTIDDIAARVGRKLGLNIRIVKLSEAEACIDVDKPEDLTLVEQILASRQH